MFNMKEFIDFNVSVQEFIALIIAILQMQDLIMIKIKIMDLNVKNVNLDYRQEQI